MKSNFEEKKEQRLERYQELAAKNEQVSEQTYNRAKQMADAIPFGQPILVGHHSEKRDRNYRDKIHNTFGAAFAASDKAAYYKQKAETLLNGTAVSSDDPNAVDKLEEKLEHLEATQELFKNINKVLRNKKHTDAEKLTNLLDLGISGEQARVVMIPDRLHGMGIPSYRITNNGANIRRIKERVEYLKKMAAIKYSETIYGDTKLVVNPEDNRVQIFFPGKPADEVRTQLKRNGFVWAPSVGAWQRQLSNHAIYYAKQILDTLNGKA